MNTKDHALDLALEALEEPGLLWRSKKAIAAIKQARSAPYVASPRVQEPDEWPTGCLECGMDSGCDCDSGTWNPPAAPMQSAERGEPIYHLRQFGDVTKEQLDRYMATGDINPQPAPVPDALTDQDPETPEYKEGWNDCRAFMLNWRNNQ
jgi:hypothetical protein